MNSLRLRVHAGRLAIVRLASDAPLPPWAGSGFLAGFLRTPTELSIVCGESHAPEDVRAERGWRALELAGPFDFGLTGILASVIDPLGAAGVSIFALSTFDTDWVLVKDTKLVEAVVALRAAGHVVVEPGS